MTMRIPRFLIFATCVLLTVSARPAAAQSLDPKIVQLVTSVSEQRLAQLIKKLQSFETRSTLSSPDSPTRGIGAARQWIFDEMKQSSPRLQVSFDIYMLAKQGRVTREVELRNVVAMLPGKSARRIYVSAHYDTLALPAPPSATPASADAPVPPLDNLAPGTNDDGSGTALTIELARVFAESGVEFDATLVFVTFAGEEQGLVGATLHAQKAAAENVAIDAVFNNDVVGNSVGGGGALDSSSVRVFSEGPEDSSSRQLARYMRRHAAKYVPSHEVRLIARHDRFGRGGDHTPFNQQGYTAVRITESKENYSRQHSVEDLVVDVSYLTRNARVDAAAIATLALAPSAPVVVDQQKAPMLGRQPSGYDANLKWKASPGAVGYRVFWRKAWTPDWEHEVTLGDVTEFVLPNVSIDDFVFGVSAIGPGGHESLVAAYVYPPRPLIEVKTVR